MPPRVDLVALSLLPVWRWRSIAEQLRNGQAPSDILHAHCADAPRGRNGLPFWSNPVRVLERAAGALVRAAAAGLHGIGQDDVAFPARLRETLRNSRKAIAPSHRVRARCARPASCMTRPSHARD